MAIAVNALLKRLAKQVIDDLDVHTAFTYVRSVPGSYDPATDTVTVANTSYAGLNGIETRIIEDDADYIVQNVKMKKLIVPYNSLLFVPTDDDYVTIDGVRWNIHKIKTVPGNAIYIFFIREP